MKRGTEGNETWKTLREWLKASAAAERLAALLLHHEGFQAIDPSHPLGGPDQLRDIVCFKNGKRWVAGVSFSRSSITFSKLKTKFIEDSKGVEVNGADAFVFITNQELSLSQREELRSALHFETDVYHLERISSLLNTPMCYGIRLEFLDIEMSKEEQLAAIAAKDKIIERLLAENAELRAQISEPEKVNIAKPQYQSIFATILSGTRDLHKCSHCGYGYVIQRDPSFALLGVDQSTGIVACPKCGNAESAA